ncbi:MAG: TetR/AcrR family transcriptional regulator [Solirubrobacteraceae bacterium]|jgi:AcrR family transcriptional regulator
MQPVTKLNARSSRGRGEPRTGGQDAGRRPDGDREAGPGPTDDRRAAILDAALEEFNAHGVAGASIDDIRQLSGASVGSIYHHFGGKDAIAGTLYLDGLREYQEGFVDALGRADSTRAGVEGAVHHHVRWVTERSELARFLLLGGDAGVVAATERSLRDLNRRFFGQVQRWTRPRVRAGELRELELELMTALWIGPTQELARLWLAGRTRISLIQAAPALAGAAWKSLTPGD